MLQPGAFLECEPDVPNLHALRSASSKVKMELWRKGNVNRREAIETSVARVFAVPVDALRSTTRGRAHIALARQIAMYLAHVVCGLSLTEVGRIFDRDRTTVSHACALVEDRRDDRVFDRLLELLERVAREEMRRQLGHDTPVSIRPEFASRAAA